MSLRSYLFSLIGGLIILLTVSQLFLVHWIEDNLAIEVNTKAKFLSEQVIELALEEFDQTSENGKIFRHKIIRESNVPHAPFKSEEELTQLIEEIAPEVQFINKDDNTVTVTVDSNGHFAYQQKEHVENVPPENAKHSKASNTDTNNGESNERHIIKRELKSLVEKIHNDNKATLTKNNDVAIFVSSPEIVSERWIGQESAITQSSTSQLIDYIQWVLIACGTFALILAYWLSVQFNKPLKNLSAGFKKLAKGNYNHQVVESGVNEIRQTISHFNDMVKHLNELTQAAKQHSEIAHLAELGEVSRGLAHALRNPIHTIGLSIEQLSDNELSAAQRQSLIAMVQNKITHIDSNIKALLTLTTTGINRQDTVPILAVVQDILLEYKSCQNKPQTFITNIASNIELLAAESEIRSICHTLIYNACDANPVHGEVRISAKISDNNYLILTVEDQGEGLVESIKNKLFQPHISTKPEGAGMGLYIANRIISLHYHGQLTLENASDIGCIATAKFKKKENL